MKGPGNSSSAPSSSTRETKRRPSCSPVGPLPAKRPPCPLPRPAVRWPRPFPARLALTLLSGPRARRAPAARPTGASLASGQHLSRASKAIGAASPEPPRPCLSHGPRQNAPATPGRTLPRPRTWCWAPHRCLPFPKRRWSTGPLPRCRAPSPPCSSSPRRRPSPRARPWSCSRPRRSRGRFRSAAIPGRRQRPLPPRRCSVTARRVSPALLCRRSSCRAA